MNPDDVARANVARHIAALANHGGGYLLFGFKDNRTPNPSSPYPKETFERDAISSIVKMYLTPTFQCEVNFIISSAGITHPVIWIPPHGGVPVCSKADGPHDQKGRPQGIKIATYYVRAPEPESVPITTPEQWAPLVRRCVVNERTTLVGIIVLLLKAPPQPSPTDVLKRWHERANARFSELARERKASPRAVQNYVCLSYAIHTAEASLLDPSRLIEMLLEINGSCRNLWHGRGL